MEKVQELIDDIKVNLKQKSANQKDETRVMRAMMNDRDYEVDIYEKSGKVGTYAPGKDFRAMVSSVVASTTKISQTEAEGCVEAYDFKKNEAEAMVRFSKEFINTYTQTGRKTYLGGRETSDVALIRKEVPAGPRRYPKKQLDANGCEVIGADGNPVYVDGETYVPGYSGIKAESPCPFWVTK